MASLAAWQSVGLAAGAACVPRRPADSACLAVRSRAIRSRTVSDTRRHTLRSERSLNTTRTPERLAWERWTAVDGGVALGEPLPDHGGVAVAPQPAVVEDSLPRHILATIQGDRYGGPSARRSPARSRASGGRPPPRPSGSSALRSGRSGSSRGCAGEASPCGGEGDSACMHPPRRTRI